MTKEICLACSHRSFWEGPCSDECLQRIIHSPDERKKFSDYNAAVTIEFNKVFDPVIEGAAREIGWRTGRIVAECLKY